MPLGEWTSAAHTHWRCRCSGMLHLAAELQHYSDDEPCCGDFQPDADTLEVQAWDEEHPRIDSSLAHQRLGIGTAEASNSGRAGVDDEGDAAAAAVPNFYVEGGDWPEKQEQEEEALELRDETLDAEDADYVSEDAVTAAKGKVRLASSWAPQLTECGLTFEQFRGDCHTPDQLLPSCDLRPYTQAGVPVPPTGTPCVYVWIVEFDPQKKTQAMRWIRTQISKYSQRADVAATKAAR